MRAFREHEREVETALLTHRQFAHTLAGFAGPQEAKLREADHFRLQQHSCRDECTDMRGIDFARPPVQR